MKPLINTLQTNQDSLTHYHSSVVRPSRERGSDCSAFLQTAPSTTLLEYLSRYHPGEKDFMHSVILVSCLLSLMLGLSSRPSLAIELPSITDRDQKLKDIHAHPLMLKGTLWEEVGNKHQLDPYLLYAVALIESSKINKGKATPWPLALNHRGQSMYPDSAEVAMFHIKQRIAQGDRSIDIGLMQINLRWHGHRVQRIEDLLDPAINLNLGAEIMAASMASAPSDLMLGIGRYHSWNDRASAIRYGQKVVSLSNRLKTTALSEMENL